MSEEKGSRAQYDSTQFEDEVASYPQGLHGAKLTAAIAFISGTGFTLFGYDQGICAFIPVYDTNVAPMTHESKFA